MMMYFLILANHDRKYIDACGAPCKWVLWSRCSCQAVLLFPPRKDMPWTKLELNWLHTQKRLSWPRPSTSLQSSKLLALKQSADHASDSGRFLQGFVRFDMALSTYNFFQADWRECHGQVVAQRLMLDFGSAAMLSLRRVVNFSCIVKLQVFGINIFIFDETVKKPQKG